MLQRPQAIGRFHSVKIEAQDSSLRDGLQVSCAESGVEAAAHRLMKVKDEHKEYVRTQDLQEAPWTRRTRKR